MGSPYQEIKPLFMILDKWNGVMTIRIRKTNDLQASIKTIEEVFKKYNSAYPFDYVFADVEFQEKFSTINMTSSLSSMFAILTYTDYWIGSLWFGCIYSRTTNQRNRYSQSDGRYGAQYYHFDIERLFEAGHYCIHNLSSPGLVAAQFVPGKISCTN